MTPTLYISPGACATASHVALQEAGIPHERFRVPAHGETWHLDLP